MERQFFTNHEIRQMKNFIHKDGQKGKLVLDTPIEVHVRYAGSPVLWTGTQEEFKSQWSPETTPAASAPADPDLAKPYNYFISFVSGGTIGNCGLRRANPISTKADLDEVQLKIKEANNLTADVGVLNFRVFDEPFPVLDWAAQVYPAVRRVLDEIRKIEGWAAYFEPATREQLERLVDYVAVGIQEKNETGVVADLGTGTKEANPGAANQG